MAHTQQQQFCEKVRKLLPHFFGKKIVVDIGCLDINGNNNLLFQDCLYLGVDVGVGRNVDFITKGHEFLLPNNSVDTIISTECFEHDQHYVQTIENIYRMLKPGGLFIFTCATTGRPEHGTLRTTPHDAPLLHSDGWSEYYKNLTEDDIRSILDVDKTFSSYAFEVNNESNDLYFWGIKSGEYVLRDDYSFLINKNDQLYLKLSELQEVSKLSESYILEVKESNLSIKQLLDSYVGDLISSNANLSRCIESGRLENIRLCNQINELDSTLQAKQQEFENICKDLHHKNQRLNKIELALDLKEHEFASVIGSNSWKLTMPLRKVGYFLRKLKKIIKYSWVFCKSGRKIYLIKQLSASIKSNGFVLGVRTFIRTKAITYPDMNMGSDDEGFITILSVPHCAYIAHLFSSHLQQVGITANIIYQEPSSGYTANLHYVICPQAFKNLPGYYVAFQLEQSVNSRWFTNDYIKILEHAAVVFDYSLINIEFLLDKALQLQHVFYLPISYFPNYSEYLGLGNSRIEESYDILFYGDINNDRRKLFLKPIMEKYNVKVISDLFGIELVKEIMKAKIIINIHYYENALLETPRLYECLSLDKLIISEKGSDQSYHHNLESVVDFIEIGDISQMMLQIEYWLKNEEARYAKIKQNKDSLFSMSDQFSFYFYRYLLSCDLINFNKFWDLSANNIPFIGHYHCLSLPESICRREDFEKDNKFGFKVYNGLRHKLGWVGCALSFKSIIKKAKELDLEYVVVCEDDVEFPDDFLHRFTLIEDYLLNNSERWDIFSGLIANLHQETKIMDVELYKDIEFIYIDKMTSTVFNVYNKSVFDVILAWNESLRDPHANTIDRFIENNEKHVRIVTTIPYLVGHKEEQFSTLWGFENTQYREWISESAKLLKEKLSNYKGVLLNGSHAQ